MEYQFSLLTFIVLGSEVLVNILMVL